MTVRRRSYKAAPNGILTVPFLPTRRQTGTENGPFNPLKCHQTLNLLVCIIVNFKPLSGNVFCLLNTRFNPECCFMSAVHIPHLLIYIP